MKRRGKLFGLLLSLVLVASLVLPSVAYAAGPNRPEKPDKEKPDKEEAEKEEEKLVTRIANKVKKILDDYY